MRQDRRAQPKAPINENITAREVRLIGSDGEQIGIVSIDEALRIAEEAKLDLVEISADAVPPVCRVMDFGKFKYRESKKQHEARLKQKADAREADLRMLLVAIDGSLAGGPGPLGDWYVRIPEACIASAADKVKASAIVDGVAPNGLTVSRLSMGLPHAWAEQEALIGLD